MRFSWLKGITRYINEIHVFVFLFSPLAYVDPGHCDMAHLFVELLKDSLNEYAYNAEIAGVEYKIENTMYGMFVSTCRVLGAVYMEVGRS